MPCVPGKYLFGIFHTKSLKIKKTHVNNNDCSGQGTVHMGYIANFLPLGWQLILGIGKLRKLKSCIHCGCLGVPELKV